MSDMSPERMNEFSTFINMYKYADENFQWIQKPNLWYYWQNN